MTTAARVTSLTKIGPSATPDNFEKIDKNFDFLTRQLRAIRSEAGGGGVPTATQGALVVGAAAEAEYELLLKDVNATRYLSNRGTNNQPQWSKVNLPDGVEGNLPIANLAGGSGASAATFLRGDNSWATPESTAQIVYRTLTAAEINSGATTPIQLVAAAGASAVIFPLSAMARCTRSGVAFSAAPALAVRWAGFGSSNLLASAFNFTLNSAVAGDLFQTKDMGAFSGTTTDNPRNLALQAYMSADTTGGTGASIRLAVVYLVVEF